MSGFSLTLHDDEKSYLKDLVRWAILTRLSGEEGEAPAPSTPLLQEKLGAFVTLKKDGHLRGCIGHLVGDKPLYLTVADMARAAAFEDPRFPPLSADEYDRISIEISIMGPITLCQDPGRITVGRHGLIVRRGAMQGLLLPQVPVEWGWDRDQFLEHTCRKAGLPPGTWREPDAQVFWFEAEVF